MTSSPNQTTSRSASFITTGNENQFQLFMLNQVALHAFKQAQTPFQFQMP